MSGTGRSRLPKGREARPPRAHLDFAPTLEDYLTTLAIGLHALVAG
jgi:hypothetical protein